MIYKDNNVRMRYRLIDISARSPTDYDWSVVYSWWTLIIDWEEYTYVPNQMMWGWRMWWRWMR